MKANLTIAFVERQKPKERRYDVRDKLIGELILRVEPSGKKSFLLDCKPPFGRRTTIKLGDASILAPSQARELAKEKLLAVSEGGDPRRKKALTFRDFIEKYYRDYLLRNQKRGGETLRRLERLFGDFYDTPLADIRKIDVEKWKTARLAAVAPATVNRYLTDFKAAVRWACTNGLIAENPVAAVRKAREPNSIKIRYLTDDERARLLAALDAREAAIRAARARSREHSNRRYLPDLSETAFADYFKPLVITALNTGIRKTALLSLKWEDIDLDRGNIVLRAEAAKSGKSSVLPANPLVLETLRAWRAQRAEDPVFPGGDFRKTWRAVLAAAGISDFRFHDLRHDFASRLVMAGVDLNTVRELLTHSDIGMTLRYAHLAPEKKRAAVDILCLKGNKNEIRKE